MDSLVMQPIVQYGFVGFAAILLVIIIWLISRLLELLRSTAQVIADNTRAINQLTGYTRDLMTLTRSMHDKLLSRPCIANGERK